MTIGNPPHPQPMPLTLARQWIGHLGVCFLLPSPGQGRVWYKTELPGGAFVAGAKSGQFPLEGCVGVAHHWAVQSGSSCVAAVSGSPCRELWFVMQGVGAPTERKLQDTSWWDSSSPSVLLCFPFSLCDQCWGAQRLVCPWDGHRQDLPCGPVDWLADEGQCYIGTEEIGSGDGTLLLVDRANLFEFRKRHHFLKILHWHVPENCCSKQTNLWWLWGERNSQELCNAKLALPLVAALLGPHWASPASPPALCLVVSSQEFHVAMK